jgi:hypothetical protein
MLPMVPMPPEPARLVFSNAPPAPAVIETPLAPAAPEPALPMLLAAHPSDASTSPRELVVSAAFRRLLFMLCSNTLSGLHARECGQESDISASHRSLASAPVDPQKRPRPGLARLST